MLKRMFLIACLSVCANCLAQQYPFVHYTPKDGLVNSRVRKAYQDSKGRMYFITYGGLSVYDGARFKNYTTQNGLLFDLVNDVLEVGDDSLLVAVNTCGLNVLVHGKIKSSGIADKHCPVFNQFFKSSDGNVYASADDGLYKINKTGFEKLSTFFPSQQTPIIYLGELTEYKDFLVFTTNDLRNYTGLFLYNKKEKKITDALTQLIIEGLKSDHTGITWVSTPDLMYNLDTIALASGKLKLRQPYATFVQQQVLAAGNISFNGQNEPLVSSANRGIVRYTKQGTQLVIATADLPIPQMKIFFIDREDVLWICHDGNGVYKLSNTKLQSTVQFSAANHSGVRMVKTFTPALTWVIMNNGQWMLHTPVKDKFFAVSPEPVVIPIAHTKTDLYAVLRNDLYMASLPPSNETKISFKKIMMLPDSSGFGDEAVVDPYENVILFENRNLCVFKHEKLIATYPLHVSDLIEGMYIDKNKMLWVVSRSNGLVLFSLHPEDPSHYLQKEFHFIKEFEDESPRCMIVDKNERLWVGTRYGGLMAFEYKNKQLKKLFHFQTQNGLTDNFVTSLAADADDNIIIGMQTGIDRLIKTRDGYSLENITKSNNIFAYITYVWTDINNTAFALTNANTVFKIEPVVSSTNFTGPDLLIEEMKVNGQQVIQTSSPLTLKYYQRNISFSLAAPTFIDEGQVQYTYSLAGSGNNGWSDTSSIADINLLNLSPGNYTLHVKAFFPSTSYSAKETTFTFEILPPWWQSWWFRIIIGLAIIGLSVVAVRIYYRRKLEKQKIISEKQQAIEKERTRIATDMHDDLGAGLSRIKFLSETIGLKKQKQQPIEEDISKIREYSHEMIDKMGEIVWALNEKNDSLSDLLSYTRSYAVEYLSQNGIRCLVNLPELLPSSFVSGEFRRNIFLAVKEILHNVVKHAQANQVTITMRITERLVCCITDDGIGFDRMNVRPYSNGLINIEKRMKDIGGTMSIQTKNGTAVSLEIPLYA